MKLCSCAALLLTLFFPTASALCAREVCISVAGLKVCVQMRGTCHLSHLMANEQSNIQMDLFYVRLINNSERRIRIFPASFHGITVNDRVITMDTPFYDSIELKHKLVARDLAPRENLDGFLFFPSSVGSIRGLVYSGSPYFEIKLY
jgi:hypothetical protein